MTSSPHEVKPVVEREGRMSQARRPPPLTLKLSETRSPWMCESRGSPLSEAEARSPLHRQLKAARGSLAAAVALAEIEDADDGMVKSESESECVSQ